MKSFDHRLQNDLFPKTPAAFDRMIERKLADVCGRSEEPQNTVVRFPAPESAAKPERKVKKIIGRIAIVSAAAVLIICTIGVGTLAVLSGRQKTTPAASASEHPTAVPDAMNTVYAATVDEFLAAIASDTRVILTGDVYNLSAAYEHDGNNHMWREVEDGYELVLCNLENFQIVGSENTVIETDPRHAEVITAEYCTGLVFSDLTIGHTKKPEKCSGEVLQLTECKDTRIENCALYGCGSWGVTAWYCGNLTVAGSEIYECSSGALHLWECTDVEVTESTIRNCGGGGTLADLIYIQDSGVSIRNCDIYENTTESSLIYVGDAETTVFWISIVGTDLHDNHLTHRNNYLINFTNPDPDESDRMTVDGCAFRNNGDNSILPKGSRVFDLDGNELGDAELSAMTLKRADTTQPGGTDACGTLNAETPAPSASAETPVIRNTVHAASVEDFLAAIATSMPWPATAASSCCTASF